MRKERERNLFHKIVINDEFVFAVKTQLLLKNNIKFIRGTKYENGRSVLQRKYH